jgi:hypothetical protein
MATVTTIRELKPEPPAEMKAVEGNQKGDRRTRV